MPRAKTDHNQADIVKVLRQMGCTVHSLHKEGGGVPDLLVGVMGFNLLLEVKNPETKGKLNTLQEKWHGEWRGQAQVVKSPDHAVRIIQHYRGVILKNGSISEIT